MKILGNRWILLLCWLPIAFVIGAAWRFMLEIANGPTAELVISIAVVAVASIAAFVLMMTGAWLSGEINRRA